MGLERLRVAAPSPAQRKPSSWGPICSWLWVGTQPSPRRTQRICLHGSDQVGSSRPRSSPCKLPPHVCSASPSSRARQLAGNTPDFSWLPSDIGMRGFGEGEDASVQGRVMEGGRFGLRLPGMLLFQGNNDGVRGFFTAFWGLILSVHKYFRRHKACLTSLSAFCFTWVLIIGAG